MQQTIFETIHFLSDFYSAYLEDCAVLQLYFDFDSLLYIYRFMSRSHLVTKFAREVSAVNILQQHTCDHAERC